MDDDEPYNFDVAMTTIRDLRKKVEQKNDEIASKDSQIDELQSRLEITINAKITEIQILNTEKDAEIAALKAQLIDQEAVLKKWQDCQDAEIAEKDRQFQFFLGKVRAALGDKRAEIAQLTEENKELTEKIERLKIEIKELVKNQPCKHDEWNYHDSVSYGVLHMARTCKKCGKTEDC